MLFNFLAQIDVFSFGNVLYEILTDSSVWELERYNSDKAIAKIKSGVRPHIPSALRNSDHPVDVALRKALDMWYVRNQFFG